MLHRVLLACVFLLGCDITQTVVVVTADETVEASTQSIRVRIEGAEREGMFTDVETGVPSFPTPTFPFEFSIKPASNDATRLFRATVTVTGRDGVETIGRVQTGFIEGESRIARIHLTSVCSGVVCAETQTCEAGQCVGAEVPIEDLPEVDEVPDAEPTRDASLDLALDLASDVKLDVVRDLSIDRELLDTIKPDTARDANLDVIDDVPGLDLCYPDFDGDGLAAENAVGTPNCLGTNVTDRRPTATEFDCDDSDVRINEPTLECFTDSDDDGFGDQQAAAQLLCGEDCPRRTSDNNDDCCDESTAAYPGQPGFFPTPACGSFDYNCDGTEDPPSLISFSELDARQACNSNAGTNCDGILLNAWVEIVPACGVQANWYSGCELTGGTCGPITNTKQQSCR